MKLRILFSIYINVPLELFLLKWNISTSTKFHNSFRQLHKSIGSKNIKSNDFTIKIHAVTLLLFTVSNNAKFMKTKFIDNGFRQLLDPVIFFSVKGQSREGEEGMILKGGICRPKGGRKVDFQIFALKFWLFPFKGTSIPWKSHWEQTSHTLVSKEGKASGRADHGESRIRENVPMDLCAFCKGKEFSSWRNTR